MMAPRIKWVEFGLAALSVVIANVFVWAAEPALGGKSNEPLQLRSGFYPIPIQLSDDPLLRKITSFQISGRIPLEGDVRAQMLLDTREAVLNEFGDVIRRRGAAPEPVRVSLRRYGTEELNGLWRAEPIWRDVTEGWRLFDIVMPEEELAGRLRLSLGTKTAGPHRLLIYGRLPSKADDQEIRLIHIVPLEGEPVVESSIPDVPIVSSVELGGLYTGLDGVIHQISLRGELGGPGMLSLNPNYITFDPFGEPRMFTMMGFRPHPVRLMALDRKDPRDLVRRVFELVPDDKQNRNRCCLVLGANEGGPRRLLIYRGDPIQLIIPLVDLRRKRDEADFEELRKVSGPEQLAISELRQSLGREFSFQIENGHIRRLGISLPGRVSGIESALKQLSYLESLNLSECELSASVVGALQSSTSLKGINFWQLTMNEPVMAALGNLRQIEYLGFRGCDGINDSNAHYLAFLSGLTRLSIYHEGETDGANRASSQITDVTVQRLSGLKKLKQLELLGQTLTDRSLKFISGLTDLNSLLISGAGITDDGLPSLHKLKKLKSLNLQRTDNTQRGVDRLRNQMPNLVTVDFFDPNEEE